MFQKVTDLNDMLCSLPSKEQTQQLLSAQGAPAASVAYSVPAREPRQDLPSEAAPSAPICDDSASRPLSPERAGGDQEQRSLEKLGNLQECRQDSGESDRAAGTQSSQVILKAQRNADEKNEPTKETEEELADRRELALPDDEFAGQSHLERIVNGIPFELSFGLLIVLNTIFMCIEAEYSGWGTGKKLGIHRAQATTGAGDTVFKIAEMFFTVAFTFEVAAKMIALQLNFFKCGWNLFDFVVIAFAWVEMVIEVGLPINPMLLRLVRLIRLLRLARRLSAYEVFDDLVLMIKGIKAGAPVLLWVVVLLLPITACSALAMNYSLLEYIEDEREDPQNRLSCFNYFGTFSKAMLSMFEVTFGNWVPICRFLYNNVHSSYAVFFMAYQLVMKIAVLRVMYGVFLKVTFDCAASDEEAIVAKKRRDDRKFAEKMKTLMKKVDSSNDGFISRSEFAMIGTDPRVRLFLSAMELDIHDASLVFELADDGDEKLSAEELAHGFSVLKGTARSMDIWAIISLTRKVLDKVNTLVSLDTRLVDEEDQVKALLQAEGAPKKKKKNFFSDSMGQARQGV